MLNNLEPVPFEQIPDKFMAIPIPDSVRTEVVKIAEKARVKQAKKKDSAKPKVNRNQSLRDEQAMKALKFKENIVIKKSSEGTKYYQCKLCQVNILLLLSLFRSAL